MNVNAGKVVNLGEQKFDRLIEENKFYIDKTDFIREWWEYGSSVTLITRPRRFGKTLNMSMVECFFSNNYENRGDLFEGLSIFSDKADNEKYRVLQGTFPVISLSFAPVKSGGIEDMKVVIKQIIVEAYKKYEHIMASDKFSDNDRKHFAFVDMYMDDAVAYMAVNQLCSYLKRYYGSDAIVLLDEYDTPMLESWLAGTWDETAAFFQNFFNHTFKTNRCLYRGLITGITRISKESIFSDLNNLKVVSITSDEYAASFGFTEDEVFAALDDAGLGAEKENIKRWYDGFTFGKHADIYNPWSIASFLDSKGIYKPYWVNTSGNGLVDSLIRRGNKDIKSAMEDLLVGRPLRVRIDEHIVFKGLEHNANAIWSLFLATGYFKVLETEAEDGEDNVWYMLDITNMETKRMFKQMIGRWFAGDRTIAQYNAFVESLLINDVESMNEYMNDVAFESFSSFDIAKSASSKDAPERFYHGFVLGLMVELAGRYEIKSNRESGYGRYDIMMIPVDAERDFAYIIEFKVHKHQKEKDMDATVANALAQIEEKQYEAELVSRGLRPERIKKYGFAFKGKECLIG